MSTPAATSRRIWAVAQLSVGLTTGLLGLAWAARGLDFRLVSDAVRQAQFGWIFIALGCVVAVALCKTVRWGVLYAPSANPIRFSDLFWVLMIAQMLNVVIPIRIGELARIGLMKQAGQTGAATLATIALEKSLDLVAAGLIALTLVEVAIAPAWIQSSASSILILGITLIVGLALVWQFRAELMRFIEWGLAFGGIVPARWQARLMQIARTLVQSFGVFTDARALIRVAFWTALIWALSPLAMLALFVAFNFPLTLSAALVLMLAFGFSNLVPSPPALVGVVQAIVVFVLGEYGIAQSLTLGYGIVLNIVMVAPLIVLGCFGLGQRAVWSFAAFRAVAVWMRRDKR